MDEYEICWTRSEPRLSLTISLGDLLPNSLERGGRDKKEEASVTGGGSIGDSGWSGAREVHDTSVKHMIIHGVENSAPTTEPRGTLIAPLQARECRGKI